MELEGGIADRGRFVFVLERNENKYVNELNLITSFNLY